MGQSWVEITLCYYVLLRLRCRNISINSIAYYYSTPRTDHLQIDQLQIDHLQIDHLQIDQIDDLDDVHHSHPNLNRRYHMLCRICTAEIQPGKHVLDRSDDTAQLPLVNTNYSTSYRSGAYRYVYVSSLRSIDHDLFVHHLPEVSTIAPHAMYFSSTSCRIPYFLPGTRYLVSSSTFLFLHSLDTIPSNHVFPSLPIIDSLPTVLHFLR